MRFVFKPIQDSDVFMTKLKRVTLAHAPKSRVTSGDSKPRHVLRCDVFWRKDNRETFERLSVLRPPPPAEAAGDVTQPEPSGRGSVTGAAATPGDCTGNLQESPGSQPRRRHGDRQTRKFS